MPAILLIEDDPETAEAVLAMLEHLGHQVHWAHNGQEALVYAKGHPAPAAVLTDILMPEMDGLETINHLHKHLAMVPIIAMSAQKSAAYLQAALVFGARTTLEKPFALPALQAALEKALGA